jgi:hypothetical protein
MCPLLALSFQGYASNFLFFFVAAAFTVLMKQPRQAVHAVKQSIFLDVYESNPISIPFAFQLVTQVIIVWTLVTAFRAQCNNNFYVRNLRVFTIT